MTIIELFRSRFDANLATIAIAVYAGVSGNFETVADLLLVWALMLYVVDVFKTRTFLFWEHGPSSSFILAHISAWATVVYYVANFNAEWSRNVVALLTVSFILTIVFGSVALMSAADEKYKHLIHPRQPQ
ncbi:MAG: hypothetical protein KC877_01910 [Candidatus Kaiserbacteria bacterium]|nr:hypothetical protein [Candidatus Kaiserbacteria bacterium]MCB9815894.1 hypothetical protein [Candidatus Nomurabacteria bacterium]